MIVRTRKAGVVWGAVLVLIGWGSEVPKLLDYVEHGLMSVISFTLLFATAMTLLIGAVAVHRGKRANITFLVHIVLAGLALVFLHFRIVVPLALGAVVAISAVLFPADAVDDSENETSADTA